MVVWSYAPIMSVSLVDEMHRSPVIMKLTRGRREKMDEDIASVELDY